MEHSTFSWFQYTPLAHLPYHVAAAGMIMVLLMVIAAAVRMGLAGAKDNIIPSEKVSFLSFFDFIAESIYKLTESILGKDAAIYFPLIGTLFLYVFLSNLLGLFPGFAPPTDNINTTFACGLFVFIYYNYVGFKSAGFAYLKHFMGPVWYLAWVLLPIEIVSHVVRPFTLALRLKGNMAGDHTVIAAFTHMAPYIVPVPFYFLGLLVCFLQAFIFVMLTMVYISMARDTAHH